MALCIQIASDGTVYSTGEAVEACSGYVLMSGSEFQTHTVIERLFDWPDPAYAAGWFTGAFSIVMGCYLVGRLVGAVSNMFNNDK